MSEFILISTSNLLCNLICNATKIPYSSVLPIVFGPISVTADACSHSRDKSYQITPTAPNL